MWLESPWSVCVNIQIMAIGLLPKKPVDRHSCPRLNLVLVRTLSQRRTPSEAATRLPPWCLILPSCLCFFSCSSSRAFLPPLVMVVPSQKSRESSRALPGISRISSPRKGSYSIRKTQRWKRRFPPSSPCCLRRFAFSQSAPGAQLQATFENNYLMLLLLIY